MTQSDLKLWTLQRDWFFGGIEVFEQFFPQPRREAIIPTCSSCLKRLEAQKRRNLLIAVITAALMIIPLAIQINLMVKKYAYCVESPLGAQFCNGFLAVFGGILAAGFLFFLLWELTSIIPGLALPARFDLLGKLGFTKPGYQKMYKYLNPSPEIPIPQHQIPWGIYLAGGIALILSILSDLDMILTGHRRDPSLQIFPTYYLIILEKAGVLVLFLKYKKIAFLLWPVIIASEYLMNPNFNIEDRGEEVVFAATLIVIYLYELWQTHRDKKLAATPLSR